MTIPKKPDWDELPPELWGIAFAYLVKKEHLALSSISRRVHGAVEPFLYSEFSWIPDTKFQLPPITNLVGRDVQDITKSRRKKRNWLPGPHGPPFYLLLRTLLHRPILAQYFKHARILAVLPGSGIFYDTHAAREGGLSKREFEICEKAIASMWTASQKTWLEGLCKGTADVALALLISRMTQLKALEIRVWPGSVAGSIIFEAITCPESPTRIEPLKSVTISIEHWDDENDPQFDPWEENMFDIAEQATRLFHIPRIQTLSISCFAPSTSVWKGSVPFAPTLKKLCLKHGCLNERMLAVILKATPNLEELDCELTFDYENLELCDCEILNSALKQVSLSLQSLILNFEILYDNVWRPEWNVLTPMGSMMHLKKLKTLEIPLITLVSEEPSNDILHDILPDGLEHFTGFRAPLIPSPSLRQSADTRVNMLHNKRPWLKEGKILRVGLPFA